MAETVTGTRGLIGVEDFERTGSATRTFSRTTSSGGTQTMTKVDIGEFLGGVFNVKDYGAVGDWASVTSEGTDDSTAIQAAIHAAAANGRGGTVYFPPGQYRIDTGLLVEDSGGNAAPRILFEGGGGVSGFGAGAAATLRSNKAITMIKHTESGNGGASFRNLGFRDYGKYVLVGAITGGPYQVGETITGGTSAATGTISKAGTNGDNEIFFQVVSGTFQTGETVTGGTSGATCTTASAALTGGVVVSAIELVNVDCSSFERVAINGMRTGNGVFLNEASGDYTQYQNFVQCWITGCKYAIRTAGRVTDVTITGGNILGANPDKRPVYDPTRTPPDSSGALIAGSRGIWFDGDTSAGAGRFHLFGVSINQCETALYMNGARFWGLFNVNIEGPTAEGLHNWGTGIFIDDGNAAGGVGDNNSIFGGSIQRQDKAIDATTDTLHFTAFGVKQANVRVPLTCSDDSSLLISGSDNFLEAFRAGWTTQSGAQQYVHIKPHNLKVGTIAHGGITGTFTLGETITGNTSGATAVILTAATSSDTVYYRSTALAFIQGETVTGAGSGATFVPSAPGTSGIKQADIAVDAITGTFTSGETIKDADGAEAVILDAYTGTESPLFIRETKGAIGSGKLITGLTSGATCTSSGSVTSQDISMHPVLETGPEGLLMTSGFDAVGGMLAQQDETDAVLGNGLRGTSTLGSPQATSNKASWVRFQDDELHVGTASGHDPGDTVSMDERSWLRVEGDATYPVENSQEFRVQSLSQVKTLTAGAFVETNGALIPDGCLLLGVTTRVVTPIGTGSGTTGYSVGISGTIDKWGVVVGTDTSTKTDLTTYTGGTSITVPEYHTGGTTAVRLTATTGNFDGTGEIRVTTHFLSFKAATD